jgi:5-methylcytosine-specific restriction endonuclease McrA
MKERVIRNEHTYQKRTASKGISTIPPAHGLSFIDAKTVQKKENKTGLPDNLKSGVESLSGIDMSDVKVHYNSSHPAQLNAHAYAQGNQIHVAPGQEKHLPHEAWHVVQQKQGRVKPTMQLKGKVNINDDAGLEKEADVMGGRAKSISNNNDSVLQSKIHGKGCGCQACNSTVQPMYIRSSKRDNFNAGQRRRMLGRNAKRNNGYYTCENCGFQHRQTEYARYRGRPLGDGRFHIDHIKHASRGGRAIMKNGRVLCGTCNTSRGNRRRVGLTGIRKYAGAHRGSSLKNYSKLRRSRRRKR